MGDYISREDAVDELQVKVFHNLTDEYYGTMQVLTELPAADVVPVVHGEWMCVPEMRGIFSSRYYCSKCGKDAIINNSERYVLSDYCPHCGSFNGGKNEV